MKNKGMERIYVAMGLALIGAVIGIVAHRFASASADIVWGVVGGLAGVTIALLWPVGRSVAMRYRADEWRLEEVEVQGLKFTSAGAQRRVAWRLFMEMMTRVTTQPMQTNDGDDGVALTSLYDLFKLTRIAIAEMHPTPGAGLETVETYALDMLNRDLRPFLTKWHPLWKAYVDGGGKDSQQWSAHRDFRKELGELQRKIDTRAEGLAKIAGLSNPARFFGAHHSAAG